MNYWSTTSLNIQDGAVEAPVNSDEGMVDQVDTKTPNQGNFNDLQVVPDNLQVLMVHNRHSLGKPYV